MTTTPDPQLVQELATELMLDAAREVDYMGIGERYFDDERCADLDDEQKEALQYAISDFISEATIVVTAPAEQPQDDGDVRAVAQLREELALVSDQAEHAIDLLARTIGSTPCRLDSWGDCDAHGFQGIETGEQCPHALARAFLAGAGRSIAALEARDAKPAARERVAELAEHAEEER